jgi:hypothetical protein
MSIKIIAILAILVIAAFGLVFMKKTPNKVITPTTTPTTAPETTTATTTATTTPTTTVTTTPSTATGEESILSDQINSLTDQQLAAISIDMKDFSTSTQNDIATDSSIFLYK